MNYGSLDFRLLKRKISIEHVLTLNGTIKDFTVRKNKLIGPCPIHKGDNRNAFVVNLKENLWYCFTQCGCGGDVVELVRKMYGFNYRETAEYLADIDDPVLTDSVVRSVDVRSFRPFTAELKLNPRHPFLTDKGIRPETAESFQVGFYSGSGFMKNCIAVRLHDVKGLPLGYMGRNLDPETSSRFGKWKMPPRLPAKDVLYNFHRIEKQMQNFIVVTECPWSVMRLQQLNIPAVALLGVNLSVMRHSLLVSAEKIIIMLDGDSAGRNATIKMLKLLEPYSDVVPVYLPDDADPDELSDEELQSFVISSPS